MAKKHITEIYQRIADATIGEIISTKRSGIEYGSTIEDMLRTMGHQDGREYKRVFNWNTCQTYIEKLADIPMYKEPKHSIKVDDFICNTWGYEQTNVDFYQVVKVTDTSIFIRAVHSLLSSYDHQQMSGKVLPCADSFKDDKIIRKTPYYARGEWWTKFECGAGRLWKGEEVDFSRYA